MCDTYGMRFEWPEDRAPSTAVVAAVAAVEDVPATELPPLHYSVAADALDDLLEHGSGAAAVDVRITFEYAGYVVTVLQDECVYLDPGGSVATAPAEDGDDGGPDDGGPDDRGDDGGGDADRGDDGAGGDCGEETQRGEHGDHCGDDATDQSDGFDAVEGFVQCDPIESRESGDGPADGSSLDAASSGGSRSDAASSGGRASGTDGTRRRASRCDAVDGSESAGAGEGSGATGSTSSE